ncbi:type II restriction enzyme, partial [Levilactobacillus namurensis]|uniref:type II restriction enzyme n=1 Tax=Levilactobacillus namurensis TaxID=380393 RepID=UPI0004662ABC
MTKLPKRKLESYEKRTNNPSFAWKILFDKYDIVKEVEDNGFYDISTKQMMRNKDVVALWQQEHGSKPIPDNRNILKFDFSTDLPNIFKEYRLQIMPIGKNTYRIAPFDMYQPLPNKTMPIMPITSPIKIASLDFNKITTEPNAQTVAEITGMLTYIFHDLDSENRTVVGTLSGKNNVSNASFSVKSQISKTPITFDINTWQSETDGVYESDDSVLILESKMKFPKDFNIRQLFVPRLLVEQIMNDLDVHKDVYAGYFVKTKDIYIFTVYKFTDLSY